MPDCGGSIGRPALTPLDSSSIGSLVNEVACLNVSSSNPLKSYRYAAPHLASPGWTKRLEDIEECLPAEGAVGIKLQWTAEVLWLLSVSRWMGVKVRQTGRKKPVPEGFDFGIGVDPGVRNCHMRIGYRPRALRSRQFDLSLEADRKVLARELLAVEFLGCVRGIVVDESCAMHVHVSLPDEPFWESYLDAAAGSGPAAIAAQARLTRAVDEIVRPCMSDGRLRMGDVCDISRRTLGRDGTEAARFGDGINYTLDPDGNLGFRAITEFETVEFRLGSSSWCADEIVSWLHLCVGSAGLLARSALGGGLVN